jgi:hypothetical protein
VQDFCDQRIRVRAEQLRALVAAMQDDLAAITDVYERGADTKAPWVDSRADGPPHLLASSDVLAYNAFATDVLTAITGHAQWPVVRRSCVRPLGCNVGL